MGQSLRADLNAVRAFVHVVDEKSFRGAAVRLGLPKSTVSRKVAELETFFGAQLLVRTTRSVRPTEAGLLYHQQASAALATLDTAARGVDELQLEPRGLLRISLPVALGQSVLGPLLASFMHAHPHVQVLADVTDRSVDLIEESFDAVIRAGELRDSSLVGRKLAQSTARIVASPTYLKGRKPPRKPQDLSHHDCVVFPGVAGPVFWSFREGRKTVKVQVKGRCAVGSFPALQTLVEEGFGIGRLPAFVADPVIKSGRLVGLLGKYATAPAALWVLHPAARSVSPKLRAFIDHLVTQAHLLFPGEA